MNPVVLIATHDRYEVTKKNIYSLMMQSVQPKIVLVVSDNEEAKRYKKEFPEIYLGVAPNTPLGNKWQHGVSIAKSLNPNPLIITGSDDILGIDYIENVCILIRAGYHFVGLKRWYVYHNNILYQYDYNATIPLGGGRAYSKRLLEEINYRLFDDRKDKHLDDFGWRAVNETRLMPYIVTDTRNEGLHIVSIKGDWPMLNPFDKFKGSRNITLLSKSRDMNDLKQLINYEC